MKIKNVVKVMNFHSLLRVDSAKQRAEKYFLLQDEVTNMIAMLINNKNLILDKKILMPKVNKKVLNIYFGSDLGFCSNYNSQVNELIEKDKLSDKILIGKKLKKNVQNVLLNITKDQFDDKIPEIQDILFESIVTLRYSEINIIYVEYKSISEMTLLKRKLFPLDVNETTEAKETDVDFSFEGKVETILHGLVSLYLRYQITLANINCSCSENIMRQDTTSESLKKIDEREEIKKVEERKEYKQKQFQKVLESYVKITAGKKNNRSV